MVRRNQKWLSGLAVAAGLTALLGLAGPNARADEPAVKSQAKPAAWGSVGSYVVRGVTVMLLPLPPKPPKPPKPEKPPKPDTPGGVKPGTTPKPPTTPDLPDVPDLPNDIDTPTIPDLPPVPEPPTTTQEAPEPATLVMGLMGLGVAGAAILRRRLKKS